MSQVDFFYVRLAIICCIVAVVFFYITTESLIKGKLRLPAWVFSSFTLVIGIFFFDVFIDSVGEFSLGKTDSLDELIDMWEMVARFMSTFV